MSLGARIRQTRNQKSITLQELSERSGLSKGFICQLENEKATPSLQALERLSTGLGVPMAYLFLKPEEKLHVVRESEYAANTFFAEGVQMQLLSAKGRQLRMVIMELPPGASLHGTEGHAHEGEECHFVLQGTVRYTQGDQTAVLRQGDSVHFNGYIHHRVENFGHSLARILCVTNSSMEHMFEDAECCDCEDDEESGEKGK
jgi:transcriptional regulator with XRE-family HTH domain